MNRKGEAADMLEWFPRLMMMLVAVIVIVMIARYFIVTNVAADNVQRSAYAYRMYYDSDLLAYEDPATGRSYPGTIDLARFTPEHLTKGYPHNGRVAAEFQLKGLCVHETTAGVANVMVVRHDSETYETLLGYARAGALGLSGATMEEHVLPVTIINDKERCEGLLKMIVVRSNS